MKTKSEEIKALKDEAIDFEFAASDAARQAKQLREKIEDLETEPEPVKCKEWWLCNFDAVGQGPILTSKKPNQRDQIRVIELLPYKTVRRLISGETVPVIPVTTVSIAHVMDKLLCLGMIKGRDD